MKFRSTKYHSHEVPSTTHTQTLDGGIRGVSVIPRTPDASEYRSQYRLSISPISSRFHGILITILSSDRAINGACSIFNLYRSTKYHFAEVPSTRSYEKLICQRTNRSSIMLKYQVPLSHSWMLKTRFDNITCWNRDHSAYSLRHRPSL